MTDDQQDRPGAPARPPRTPVPGAPDTRTPVTGSAAGRTSGASDGDVGGWAGRVMVFLRYGTQVVGINLLIGLGTLAGGVLLGAFPALGSGGALLARLAAGDPSEHVWSEFWHGWGAGWRRLNVLGAPLWVVGALLGLDAAALSVVEGPAAGVLTAGLVLAGAYATVVAAFLLPAARRYDEPARRTWRFLAVAPLLSPGTALGVLSMLVIAAVAFWQLTVLLPLAGVALPLLGSGWLVDQRLDVLDAR
jgi:uncharacterized membrane protein YesL